MITRRRAIKTVVFLLVVMTGLMVRQAEAMPFVTFSAVDLGEGVFEYDLTLSNSGGGEALSGLIVLNGNSVFGLDETSVIGAPDGWSFFPPLFPVVDPLFYFSGGSATDVAIDGSLMGFSFESTKDPASIAGGDFAVVGIGAILGRQIPLGTAQAVPEPTSLLLVVVGLAATLVGLSLDNGH